MKVRIRVLITWTVVAALSLSATGLAIATVAEWVSGLGRPDAPVAVLPCTIVDLGMIDGRANWKATFAVQNIGGRRLILSERSQSCSCLVSGQPEIIIGPGESDELVVWLDSRHLKGSFASEVHFESNDPQKREIVLLVRGHVVPGFEKGSDKTGGIATQPRLTVRQFRSSPPVISPKGAA